MKLICIPLVLVAVSISAQKTEKKIPSLKIDTLNTQTADLLISKKDQQKDLYKILVVKPKDTAIYSCLKDKRKDTTAYKILNLAFPEKIASLPKEK
ncbi:hypothetical protein PFY12_01620 [Chryseobacterium camelliae]|uniref:Uncharacterized protein n=1 Tax=Chryseobacterium camelliae TaxID=1265445 RepID=A0ABY7QP67_9FLAO|nr:hypothetical protein [Chryseobacterium camelliae]WBV60831.1 hypothetical protein PFY12_01620 [Chryseobacterium camelliae]